MADTKTTLQAKCFHPIGAMKAIMIKGDEEIDGISNFQIYMVCEICGKEIVMVSRGHVASAKERETLKVDDGNLREDPQPGYG